VLTLVVLPAVIVLASSDKFIPLPKPLSSSLSFLQSYYHRLFQSAELSVLVLNDVHYDPDYLPTGHPDTRCRSSPAQPNASHPFGQYGCDTPQSTIISLLSYAQTVTANPSFIAIPGDFAAQNHGQPGLFSIVQDVLSLIESAFPGVPIYATMGEADFDPTRSDRDNFASFALSQKWLRRSELATFEEGGYFSHDFGVIRILFLNSVVYSVKRKHTGDADPLGQFAWIATVAADAEAAGLSLGVAMHIPPTAHTLDAKAAWYPEYAARFENLSRRYDFQFAFVGHSHLDQFLPLLERDNERHLLGAPSVSPMDGNNPGFRVYTLAGRGVKNYQQYFADITKDTGQDLVWKLEYDFAAAYGVADASPANLQKAAVYAAEDVVGRRESRPRLYNQAIQRMRSYYCALTKMTVNEIVECQKNRGTLNYQ
jgi:sphingomyelin phosphodiesterase acid-like 3